MLLSGFTWSAVHAILAALTFIGGPAFWVLWQLHTRLRELEEGGDEREEALFGSSENPLHVGLAKEVKKNKQSLDEAEEERRELKEQLNRTERKVDKVLAKLDERDE